MENAEKRARKWSNEEMQEYATLIKRVPDMLMEVDIMDLIYLSEMYQEFADWMKRAAKWDYIFEQRVKPLFPHTIDRVGDHPRINCLAWYFMWNNYVKLQDSMFFHNSAMFNFYRRNTEPITLSISMWKGKDGSLHFWTADRNVRFHIATRLELVRLEKIRIDRETMVWTVDSVQDFYRHTATVIYMVMEAGWFLSVQQYHRRGEPPFQSFVRERVE